MRGLAVAYLENGLTELMPVLLSIWLCFRSRLHNSLQKFKTVKRHVCVTKRTSPLKCSPSFVACDESANVIAVSVVANPFLPIFVHSSFEGKSASKWFSSTTLQPPFFRLNFATLTLCTAPGATAGIRTGLRILSHLFTNLTSGQRTAVV